MWCEIGMRMTRHRSVGSMRQLRRLIQEPLWLCDVPRHRPKHLICTRVRVTMIERCCPHWYPLVEDMFISSIKSEIVLMPLYRRTAVPPYRSSQDFGGVGIRFLQLRIHFRLPGTAAQPDIKWRPSCFPSFPARRLLSLESVALDSTSITGIAVTWSCM